MTPAPRGSASCHDAPPAGPVDWKRKVGDQPRLHIAVAPAACSQRGANGAQRRPWATRDPRGEGQELRLGARVVAQRAVVLAAHERAVADVVAARAAAAALEDGALTVERGCRPDSRPASHWWRMQSGRSGR